MIVKQGRSGRVNPYSMEDVRRDEHGVLRYTNLPPSLLAMLRTTVDARPDREALVELGGERADLRGAVGPRGARRGRPARRRGRARRPRGDPARQRRSTGCSRSGARSCAGAVVVPVNTRFTEPEVDYVVSDSGAHVVIAPGAPLPDGEPSAVEDLAPRRPRGDLLHERHDGLPEGRDDHPRELPVQLRDAVAACIGLPRRRRGPQR